MQPVAAQNPQPIDFRAGQINNAASTNGLPAQKCTVLRIGFFVETAAWNRSNKRASRRTGLPPVRQSLRRRETVHEIPRNPSCFFRLADHQRLFIPTIVGDSKRERNRYCIWRVGAHLAVRAPPGTVRAILTAYGSTSETAERHIFQRGPRLVTFVTSPQLGLRPLVDKTEIAPIVIATGLSSDNLVMDDFGCIVKR